MMATQGSETLHIAERSLGVPLGELDIPHVRELFGDLFDDGAQATIGLGLDLDDVVFEKTVRCTCDEAAWDVPVQSTQRDHLLAAIFQSMPRACSPERIQLVGLVMHVIRDSTPVIRLHPNLDK